MHRCSECSTEYTSKLAAEECAEMDAEDARRQRQWTRTHEIKNGMTREKPC